MYVEIYNYVYEGIHEDWAIFVVKKRTLFKTLLGDIDIIVSGFYT